MSKTIEISRELVDHMINALDDEGWRTLADEAAAILAAPAVERQEPVAEVDRHYQGYLKWTAYGQLESPRLPDGTMLYASPPAPVVVDELQAIQDRHDAWMAGLEQGRAELVAVAPDRNTINAWMAECGWQNSTLRQADLPGVEKVLKLALAYVNDKVKEMNK